MYVSTRCNFKDFSIVWISVTNHQELVPLGNYPKLTKELIKELNLEKGIEMSMSVFLLEAENKKALFDAGYFENNMGVPQRLQEFKISPDEIDYIFITHSHWDHIEELILNGEIVYKNAKIYISKEEYNGKLKKIKPDKIGLYEEFFSLLFLVKLFK